MNKFSPGGDCICCEPPVGDPCILLEDDFNRADSSSPGSDWVEETGNCSIASNTMTVVSSSHIIATNPNPDDSNTVVTVKFTLPDSSAGAYVFLGWLDASTYLYCLVRTTFIRVGDSVGTYMETLHTISTGVQYSLTVCYDGEFLVGRVSGAGEAVISGLVAPGDRHGLGAFASTIIFDDFAAKKVSEDCESCTYTTTVPCAFCETGDVPRFWRVDISGVATGTTPGSNCTSGCSDINGTYIIDLDTAVSHGDDESTGHGSCGGEVEGPALSGCPGSPGIDDGNVWVILHAAYFRSSSPFQRDTRVHIVGPFGASWSFIYTGFYRWGTAVSYGDATPVIPCEDTDMVGLEMDPTPSQLNPCDFSGATVTITPLP